MTCSEIRAKARENLGNNIFGTTWMMALLVCLICGAILAGLSATGIGGIVVLILTGPLYVGVFNVFLSIARGTSEVKLEQSFGGFTQNVSENILLGLMMNIFITLWTFLFIIPGIVKSYSYSMSYYIKNDHPEYTWQQCIDESRRIMNGNKARLFLLDLSFIGWIIVGALCLGIGTLWVTPYQYAARAVFYEEIKNA